MSQFLNVNEIALAHVPIISWKGKTFTQITTSIKKNTGNVAGSTVTNSVYKKGKFVF